MQIMLMNINEVDNKKGIYHSKRTKITGSVKLGLMAPPCGFVYGFVCEQGEKLYGRPPLGKAVMWITYKQIQQEY